MFKIHSSFPVYLHTTFLEQAHRFVKFLSLPIQHGKKQPLVAGTLLGNWEKKFLHQKAGKSSFFF